MNSILVERRRSRETVERLTRRQAEVLAWIRRSVEERGFPPSRAEIGRAFGFASPNAVASHLRLLARKGAIAIEPELARGIRILAEAPEARETGLPVVGRVAAGRPILAEEHVEDRLAVDPRMFRPQADYLLRVIGDSMEGAGILDGDLVAVHRVPEVANGAVAVVRVEGEVTVKRWRRNGRRLRLLPENPRHRPIEVDLATEACVVEGVVVGVIRNRV